MPKPVQPRSGSMGVWPRRKASKMYARVRGWSKTKSEKPLLAFAGYKVGMTHVMGVDNKKTSMTKKLEIRVPVTVLECPPIRILAARFYRKNNYGTEPAFDFQFKPGKDVERKLTVAKSFKDVKELDSKNPDDFSDISVIVYTQPASTGFARKRPEVFEVRLAGSNKDKLEFIKANADKDIPLDQVFREGQFVDVRAVTKGKGIQGPVKRFGIHLKGHKTENGRRQPGSRGGWSEQQHVMYRTAYAGQMGFHQRVQYNIQIVKIGTEGKDVNPKDGFPGYGLVKGTYALVKGSLPGARKRMVILTHPMRAPKGDHSLPTISHISLQSKQGR